MQIPNSENKKGQIEISLDILAQTATEHLTP